MNKIFAEVSESTDQSSNTARLNADFSVFCAVDDRSSLRNIRLGSKRTSVRLENEMWAALEGIGEDTGLHLNDICTKIFEHRGKSRNFTSDLRVFIISYYRRQSDKN